MDTAKQASDDNQYPKVLARFDPPLSLEEILESNDGMVSRVMNVPIEWVPTIKEFCAEKYRAESVDRGLRSQRDIQYWKTVGQKGGAPAPELASDNKIENELAVSNQDLLKYLTNSTVYTFIDWEDYYLKLGYSQNFKKPISGRRATHERNQLELVAFEPGQQEKEQRVLDAMKLRAKTDPAFKPRRGTKEEFKISKKVIDLLVEHQWPLGDDPYALLKDTRQRSLFD